MKCLENYTIEQVKEMSFEEIKLLAEKVAKEEWTEQTKQKIINMIDVMDNVINIHDSVIES